ncbi:MAG: YjbQ family protein [Zoogloeaceae bacterium]|nr:YjbQ family protein [Zoogloeaceae bacterium]
MIHQDVVQIQTSGRGTYAIDTVIRDVLGKSRLRRGVVNLFVQHTSCSLIITENADPDVRRDLEALAADWAPDGDSRYRHDLEGPDDMAAHARSVITHTSLSIPFSDGGLLLGTWQGLFLWEHRQAGHLRSLVVTVMGEAR